MDTSKEIDVFKPLSKKLSLTDFKDIVKQVNEQLKGKETPLYKYHKPDEDLAEILYYYYANNHLHVYERKGKEGIPCGLLMYSIENLWWIQGTVLLEHLVLSLDRKDYGFGTFCINTMEKYARANNCILVISGASMANRVKSVANMYKKKGFIVYGMDFLKELNTYDSQ